MPVTFSNSCPLANTSTLSSRCDLTSLSFRHKDDAYDFTVRACNLGHFRSCLNAGILNCFDEKSSQYPLTRAPDRKKGLGYLKKACDEGELADACFRYSAQFIQGMKTTDVSDSESVTCRRFQLFLSSSPLELFGRGILICTESMQPR